MIDTGDVITICVVVGGLIGQAAYLKGTFTAQINNHEKEIDELKKTVRFKDTCVRMFDGLDHRVTRLEGITNGKGRP